MAGSFVPIVDSFRTKMRGSLKIKSGFQDQDLFLAYHICFSDLGKRVEKPKHAGKNVMVPSRSQDFTAKGLDAEEG